MLEIRRQAVLVIISVFLFAGFGWITPSTPKRPKIWAQPVKLDGVHKLYRVTDAIYRSEQPSSQGMKNLKQLGIKTILSLRTFHSDRGKIGETGLDYERIFMKPWHGEEEDAVRFLQIVTDPKRTPVLVHCQRGSDRTGAMIAIYRIAVQGWSKDEAIREMTEGGFGFHKTWSNLIRWIQNLNIERVRRLAGIKAPPQKQVN